MVVALLGKVKGESYDRAHLIPSVLQTRSEVDVKQVLDRLLDVKQ